MNRKLLAQLFIFFLITQALGLYVGSTLIKEEVKATIITEDPEDVVNSVALFAYILVFTAILLVVITLLKGWLVYLLFKVFELLAVFGTSVIVFAAFFNSFLVLVPAVAIVALRIIFKKNIWLRNMTSVIAVAGAGALIGVSLGLVPVIVFVILLAVYDFIAVFKTKHMVVLAKAITNKNLSFTYAMPTKEHTFELGTGDMVIPLTLAVSALAYATPLHPFPFNWVPPIAVLVAALAGQLWTMDYSSRHVGKALPALPPQAIAMVAALAVLKLIGF